VCEVPAAARDEFGALHDGVGLRKPNPKQMQGYVEERRARATQIVLEQTEAEMVELKHSIDGRDDFLIGWSDRDRIALQFSESRRHRVALVTE